MESASRWPRARWVGLAVVTAAAGWARFPPLLNANELNSDGAIVGVQAMQMLAGDWQKSLYGSAYQAAVEPALSALLFLFGGPSAFKVLLVPFLGMVVMAALTFIVLSREMSPQRAVLPVLTLAFASMAINSPMVYVMRQALATTLVLGVFLLQGAGSSRFWPLRYGVGALVVGLTVFIDTFALVMAPAIALYGVLCLFDGRPALKLLLLRGGCALLGAALAFAAAKWVGHLGDSQASGLSFANLQRNLPLFENEVLPFTLGFKVWIGGVPATVYPTPAALVTAQKVAAVLFALLWFSAVPLLFVPRIPFAVKRLGVLGFAGGFSALAIFLASTAPVDAWSLRYLAPLLWLAPFALAPVAWLLNARGTAVLLVPYLASAAFSGWVSWGHQVNGPLPVLTDRGRADDERVLRDFLRSRQVTAAASDYWLAYRFDLLFEQSPVVVPLNPGQDRFAPYRQTFDQARTVAYLFHPSEPRAHPAPYESMLQSSGQRYERHVVAGFTVLIHSR